MLPACRGKLAISRYLQTLQMLSPSYTAWDQDFRFPLQVISAESLHFEFNIYWRKWMENSGAASAPLEARRQARTQDLLPILYNIPIYSLYSTTAYARHPLACSLPLDPTYPPFLTFRAWASKGSSGDRPRWCHTCGKGLEHCAGKSERQRFKPSLDEGAWDLIFPLPGQVPIVILATVAKTWEDPPGQYTAYWVHLYVPIARVTELQTMSKCQNLHLCRHLGA